MIERYARWARARPTFFQQVFFLSLGLTVAIMAYFVIPLSAYLWLMKGGIVLPLLFACGTGLVFFALIWRAVRQQLIDEYREFGGPKLLDFVDEEQVELVGADVAVSRSLRHRLVRLSLGLVPSGFAASYVSNCGVWSARLAALACLGLVSGTVLSDGAFGVSEWTRIVVFSHAASLNIWASFDVGRRAVQAAMG